MSGNIGGRKWWSEEVERQLDKPAISPSPQAINLTSRLTELRRKAFGPAVVNRLRSGILPYLLSTVMVLIVTSLLLYLHIGKRLATVSMFYLLIAYFTAVLFGRFPALFASVVSFFSFSFFFVPPKNHLFPRDTPEVLALLMFLITATVTGQLSVMLKQREQESRKRQLEASALAAASWAVANGSGS